MEAQPTNLAFVDDEDLELDRHPNDLTTDEEIDAALELARRSPEPPRVLEAVFRPEPELQLLMLKLSNGRRLFIPREELLALRNATDEQAQDIRILSPATAVYWPQLDDGLHVPEFLAQDWHPLDERLGKPDPRNVSSDAQPIAA